ncbi:MAG: nucleotidyltransferase family protein [Actinomycetota bacterium]|nr:nucleotidyltransferase family protein [Actinomycetota bacterium]
MEAILLAGGQAKRLGAATASRPKALVPVAGRPLAEYTVRLLAAAGVDRLIVSCAAGQGELFASELVGIGPAIVPAEEPERLGRGGGLRFAMQFRRESGPVYALNADELLALDFPALLARHRERGPAATIVVAPLTSPFGIVEVADDDVVAGFREAPRLPHWVNVGVYVLDEEALARLPERGDHERTTFPELAADGRLSAFRYEGIWLTVNTQKDLERAEAHLRNHPDWPFSQEDGAGSSGSGTSGSAASGELGRPMPS